MDSGKAFIFDFDGVITRVQVDWTNVRKSARSTFGMQIEGFSDFFEKTWGTEQFDKVSEFLDKYETEALFNSEPYPDVLPSLKIIKSKGHRAYVATMQCERTVNSALNRWDMSPYFEKILGRETSGSKSKELRRIIELEAGTPLKQIIFIDDRSLHIEAGRELGITSVKFTRENPGSLSVLVNSLV